jgi:uncharacterized protein with PIN domain
VAPSRHGGSNGWRLRLWKVELQNLADQIGSPISVCHFPPGTSKGRQLDAFISRAEVRVEAVTREHADIARQAYIDFGEGNHAARLNFGDCFAYALSRATGLPLLFKGDDFAKTDLASALN